MVKFGKKFIQGMTPEWQNDYISYKSLKKYIRENLTNVVSNLEEETLIDIKQHNDLALINNQEGELGNETVSILSYSPLNNKQFFERIYKTSNGKILKGFLELMDKEIHKVYIFYSKIEREIYLQINTLLHRRQSYSTFTKIEIYKEIDNLIKVAYLIKTLCIYINDNMMAVKKILKKFDKKFSKHFNNVTIRYLKNLIDQQHSDLNYILQYKIVDESNTLIEDMMKDMKDNLTLRNKKNKVRLNLNSDRSDSFLTDTLFTSRKSSLDFNQENNEKYSSEYINSKFTTLENLVCEIDEISTFKVKIQDWDAYVTDGYKIIKDHISQAKGETNRSFIATSNEDEHILKKFVSNKNGSIYYNEKLSSQNNANIIITLLHTFNYLFLYSISLPTIQSYLKNIDINPANSGIVYSFTSIGAMFSVLTSNKWTNKSFINPLILSLILSMIGSLSYALGYSFKNVVIVGLGRFFIGFGSARLVNRRYLVQFIPKSQITKYSFYYVLASTYGLILGPLVAFVLCYFDEFENVFGCFTFNKFTYPGWIGVLTNLILLLITLAGYTEPLSNSFSIFEKGNVPFNVFTREEKQMLTEIDDKLKEKNQENKFTDNNLVQTNIENIKNKQRSPFSYIYKCFFILFFILFAVRICSEAIFITFPYYMTEVQNFSIEFISLFFCGTLTIMVIMAFVLKKYVTKTNHERKLLIYLLFTSLVSSLLVNNLIIPSIWKYCILTAILIISNGLMEILSSSLLTKIIPPNWHLLWTNAGFIITFSTTQGRSLGFMLGTICYFLVGNTYLILLTFSIIALMFFLIIILFVSFYSEIRVKSLARLLKS